MYMESDWLPSYHEDYFWSLYLHNWIFWVKDYDYDEQAAVQNFFFVQL